MYEIRYLLTKVKFKLSGGKKEIINNYFRKSGMLIGSNCTICCNIMTTEPYLIKIGDNVTIAGNVSFITHDNSISKIIPEKSDLFGYIKIGNNCFIGANSTIMYGISLANNIIVASGSVVTKSFNEERVVIGGNPARIIGSWDSLFDRYKDVAINIHGMGKSQKKECVINNLVVR